jgi:drug/metabolite transporter (DMT)-like permease
MKILNKGLLDAHHHSTSLASRLQLLGAAFLFSTGGAAIKAATLNGWQVASFRSGVAAAALLLFLPESRRVRSWRVLLVGLAYASCLILFVLSNKLTIAANAIFLQSTAPLYLLLLGPWLLKERIRRADLILMGVLGLGMSMFFLDRQIPVRTAPDPALGNVLALVSGISWALTLAGLRWVGSLERFGQPLLATVTAGNALACILCLPMALPAAAFSPQDVLVIGYLGTVQIGLAYVFLTRAMRSVPALESSLLLLAEPALNPIWAALVHGERPGGFALLGGSLILAATLASVVRRKANAPNVLE